MKSNTVVGLTSIRFYAKQICAHSLGLQRGPVRTRRHTSSFVISYMYVWSDRCSDAMSSLVLAHGDPYSHWWLSFFFLFASVTSAS
jgi:hypothetical protein